eukprot:6194324-Pleurochrysis_carterae.AAC.4
MAGDKERAVAGACARTVSIYAQFRKGARRAELLQARMIDDVSHELVTRQRRQIYVEIDGKLAVRLRGRVHIKPVARIGNSGSYACTRPKRWHSSGIVGRPKACKL